MSRSDLGKSGIFPMGEKLESGNFNGTVWVNRLTSDPACPVWNVTFEPGCRNSWHKHPGGQVLLVTEGRGYYQEWGKPAQELRAGDVVQIPADVKHWHGAARDSRFVHLAIEVSPEKGPADWLEPVSEEDYGKLQ
ncbi:MAG: cupin domain-containing protein [Synergistales bacterium]